MPAMLLESLRRMAAAGHRPSQYLVVWLTDQRVKAVSIPVVVADAAERAEQLRNEFGPFSEAFLVGCEDTESGMLACVADLLTGIRREYRMSIERQSPSANFRRTSGWQDRRKTSKPRSGPFRLAGSYCLLRRPPVIASCGRLRKSTPQTEGCFHTEN